MVLTIQHKVVIGIIKMLRHTQFKELARWISVAFMTTLMRQSTLFIGKLLMMMTLTSQE